MPTGEYFSTSYREARQKFLTATVAACATVTSRVLQDLRVEEPGHFTATSQGVAEISFSQPAGMSENRGTSGMRDDAGSTDSGALRARQMGRDTEGCAASGMEG